MISCNIVKKDKSFNDVSCSGVLDAVRTHDLTIRNRVLYPAELQGHIWLSKTKGERLA